MTVPNKLTLSRVVATPFFVLLFYFIQYSKLLNVQRICAICFFVLYTYMEISDILDGKIARSRNLVTDLGKVFDPFADSLMHLTFFALFTHFKYISFIAFYLIMLRELSILFIRLLLAKTDKVLPANIFGKFKTFFYAVLSFFVICYVVLNTFIPFAPEVSDIAMHIFHYMSYLAAFFSLLSFSIYFFKDAVKIFFFITK